MSTPTDTGIEIGAGSEGKSPPHWPDSVAVKMRQIFSNRFDIPITALLSMVDAGLIDLAPDFQRRERWTRKRKSRFIESIIMNVPIPPVFLGENQPGKWVVLDGRQRLMALDDFLRGKYRLGGLDVWKELNGKRFKDLGKMHAEEAGRPGVKVALDIAITRRFIAAIVVMHNSSPEVKYEVFDRLNTGGVIAEPMEVRNAIYRGPFNTLLHEVADSTAFRRLWGIPIDEPRRVRNPAYRAMVDLEMVLRFFAMERYLDFKGHLKDFLTATMADLDDKPADSMAERKDRCMRAIESTLAALGEDAFTRVLDSGARSAIRSAPLADAVLCAMTSVDRTCSPRPQVGCSRPGETPGSPWSS